MAQKIHRKFAGKSLCAILCGDRLELFNKRIPRVIAQDAQRTIVDDVDPIHCIVIGPRTDVRRLVWCDVVETNFEKDTVLEIDGLR